jgi:hypothetical protein
VSVRGDSRYAKVLSGSNTLRGPCTQKCYGSSAGDGRFWFCREAKRSFPREDPPQMHDLILAAAFAAMILTPCIIASISGKGSSEEEA